MLPYTDLSLTRMAILASRLLSEGASGMVTPIQPSDVQSVDRIVDDVIVNFRNGRSAIFTSTLLYSMLAQAQELPTDSGDEE